MSNSTLTSKLWFGAGLCDVRTDAAKYVFTSILVLLAFLTTFGNAFVIVTICRNKALRTASSILIGIIAFLDFSLGSVVVPLVIWIVFDQSLKIFKLVNLFWVSTSVILLSISTVGLFTLDRFFQVYRLGRYKLTPPKLPIAIFVCWIPSLLIIGGGAMGIVMLAEVFAALYFLICSVLVIVTDICTTVMLSREVAPIESSERLQFRGKLESKRQYWMIIVRIFIIVPPLVSFIVESVDLQLNVFCVITSLALFATSAVNPFIHCMRSNAFTKSMSKRLNFVRKKNEDEQPVSEENWTLAEDDCMMRANSLVVQG